MKRPMATQTCSACQATIPDTADFCRSCGTVVTKSTAGNKSSMSKKQRVLLIALIGGIVLIAIIAVATSEDTASPAPRATQNTSQRPTAVPVPTVTRVPPPRIRAEALYAEREANATRYDMNYMGKLITISGVVGEVDDGEVRLVVDMESYRILDGLFFSYVALHDLSQQEQSSVNKGEEFTAICEVGNYVSGHIRLEDCRK